MSHAQPGARAPAFASGAPHGTPQPIAPGVVVGERYRVLDELGFGGMGAVFLVEHVHIERRAAMKVLRVERWSEELVRRFHREARAAARVVSDRVTTVTDFGMDAAFGPFYVMDLLVGETLEQRVERDGPVPEDDLIRIAVGIADALVDVHAEGIVHRDVKPSNVGLSTGSVPVKLLDFGLAAATEEAAFLERITRSNEIIGSVAYMSPEQLQGFRPTFAVDLYGLGVTLFEAATGRLPFSGASPGVIIAQHISAAPPPLGLNAHGVQLSAELDAIVRQLMAKDPARRYPSAAVVRDTLASLLGRGRTSYPQTRPSAVVETRAAEPVKSSPPVPNGAISSGVRSVPSPGAAGDRASNPHARRDVSPYGPTVGMDSSPAMPLLPTSLVPASFPPTISTRAATSAPPAAGPASVPGPWAEPRPSAPGPHVSHGHWPQPMQPGSTERVMAPTMAAMPHMAAVAPTAPRASSNGLLFAMVGLGAGMLLATLVVLGVLLATRKRTTSTAPLPPPAAVAPPVVAPVLQPDGPALVAPIPVEPRAPAISVPPPTLPAPAAIAPPPSASSDPGTVLPHPVRAPTTEAPATDPGGRPRVQRPGARRPPRPAYEIEPAVERPTPPPPPPPPTRRSPTPWTGEVIDDPR
ncbi:MAG: protein kinase [Deltaproteobacteria bacterium]|nr:protein kinase [Deltaproteobacteria bacterium]